jgi:hypothetical protein
VSAQHLPVSDSLHRMCYRGQYNLIGLSLIAGADHSDRSV